jgi:aminomuconate-semialdehyde/2-hydroxymuconate-6-semialdehyde dehydrogenase
VKAISFTGSTRAGEDIARTAAPMFKKISLELGGKNPNIIFDDADIDDAVNTSVLSSFSNQGQICLCGSRMFIHERIYTTFKEKFVAKVRELKVGDPNEAESRVGAVVSKQHEEKVLSYITLAKQEGGTILCGGEKVNVPGRCADGYFIAPTVIEGLAFNCRTNQEEIFGPVVTITPFSSEEEVLQMANSVQYGLAASLWTNDIKRAHRLADKLECGIVWINSWMVRDLRTPFGGVKSSGVGARRWLGSHAFLHGCEKCICKILVDLSISIMSENLPKPMGLYPYDQKSGFHFVCERHWSSRSRYR